MLIKQIIIYVIPNEERNLLTFNKKEISRHFIPRNDNSRVNWEFLFGGIYQ